MAHDDLLMLLFYIMLNHPQEGRNNKDNEATLYQVFILSCSKIGNLHNVTFLCCI